MFREERVGVVGTLGEKARGGEVVCAFILLLSSILLHINELSSSAGRVADRTARQTGCAENPFCAIWVSPAPSNLTPWIYNLVPRMKLR